MLTSNMEIFLKEIFNMEDLDKDIVVFNDEEGNEIELEVVDYFDYAVSYTHLTLPTKLEV